MTVSDTATDTVTKIPDTAYYAVSGFIFSS
nr:MAG TPA: hypothetical protein [Caudoviricetes sp.]